ncbi:hypothetical protein PtA15_13A383 [Puccinia triticina]|uniref:Amino acid transporter transmembrane domain-containing protein n=1 Tax=Puccinia triticina TaxID=208348 RepID=A0ABY7D084_9BASI|nr:uncharacterized protein PtA15_13A383 [Puccinia triticina]WAQ90983.1 hypothetical protein PtA15_13A383 [Puccinia triticina]
MSENDGSNDMQYSNDTDEPLLDQDPAKTGASSLEDANDCNHLLDAGTGMLAVVVDIPNRILCAGIIGLPCVLRNAGFVGGA